MYTEEASPAPEKYFQIRVKSINFLDKPATAVYFYEMTSQVKTLQLANELWKQELKKNAICSLSPQRMQNEVQMPLSVILMLLQSLLQILENAYTRQLV